MYSCMCGHVLIDVWLCKSTLKPVELKLTLGQRSSDILYVIYYHSVWYRRNIIFNFINSVHGILLLINYVSLLPTLWGRGTSWCAFYLPGYILQCTCTLMLKPTVKHPQLLIMLYSIISPTIFSYLCVTCIYIYCQYWNVIRCRTTLSCLYNQSGTCISC